MIFKNELGELREKLAPQARKIVILSFSCKILVKILDNKYNKYGPVRFSADGSAPTFQRRRFSADGSARRRFSAERFSADGSAPDQKRTFQCQNKKCTIFGAFLKIKFIKIIIILTKFNSLPFDWGSTRYTNIVLAA